MPALPPTMWGEIFVDGAWQELTGIDTDEPMTAMRGRSGERSSAGPNQGSMKLINTGAKYSRRNPNSPLFGSIGLNTPCRYGVEAGSAWVAMEGVDTDDAYLSTPSSTALDVTGDLDVRIEVTMDQPTGLATGLPPTFANRYGSAGNRSWFFGVTSVDALPFLAWSTDGTAFIQVLCDVPVPAMPGRRMALRTTLDVDNGSGGYTVRFSTAKSVDAAEADWQMLGAPTVTTSGTTSVFNPTRDLWVGGNESVAASPCLTGNLYRFQLHDSNGIIADLDTSVASPGATSFTDSQSLVWTLNGNSEVTNRYPFMYGEVSSWQPERNKSGAGSRVAIEPAGISQRLTQGEKPLRSPLFRAITDATRTAIVAYWPFEEADRSQTVASALGQEAMTVTGTPTFASDTTWLGSDPLPVAEDGIFTAPVASYSVTGETTVRLYVVIPSGGVSASTSLFSFTTTGSAAKWNVELKTDGDLAAQAFDSDGATLLDNNVNFNANGSIRSVVLELTQNGADVDWLLIAEEYTTVDDINDTVLTPQFGATLSSETVGRITSISVGTEGGLEDVVIGHLAIGNDLEAFSGLTYSAIGWNGESARSRFNRLCAEEGVIGAAAIDDTDAPLMGSQKSAELFDLLRQVETTDNGILSEAPDTPALAYRGSSTMWSQQIILTLDHSAGVIDDITVKDDTRASFNEVTANRIDGSEFTYTKETGTNSVAEIGRTNTKRDLSLSSDTPLPSHAFWRVQQATVDEMRFPQIRVSLANERVFQMIDAVYGVDIGDLIRLDNVPDDYGAGFVDLIVVGIRDAVSASEWSRTFICVPGEPWNAFIVGSEGHDRTDTDGSELAEAMTSTQTSVEVLTTGLARWADSATYPSDFPFDVVVGGERMTVTAVAGPDWSFENGVSGWEATDGTFVQSATQAFQGTFSGLLTVTGTPTQTFVRPTSADRAIVDVGTDYTTSMWVYSTPGDAVSAAIDWFDAAGGYLSTSAAGFTVPAATWTLISVTGTAPATAATASYGPTITGSPTAGDAIFLDTVEFSPLLQQTFTVTRSVNGVVTSHESGDDIRLFKPVYLTL